MKFAVRIVGFGIPLLAVILVVLQVIVSNQLATLGKRLGELESDIIVEKDRKMALETEVASRSALLAIREKAELMGFVEPTTKQILNLVPEVPVAFETNGSAVQ